MMDADSDSPMDSPSAAPAFATGAMDNSPDPESDEEDEWDMQSVLSDTPSEALLEEDEDDIVPLSFNLSTAASPSPDNDHSESNEQVPGHTPNPETNQPFPHNRVYGSDSGYPIHFFLLVPY